MELNQYLSSINVILASNSPRRKELLSQLGIDFVIKSKDVDESYPKSFRPEAVAVYIAEKKANSFIDQIS